VTSRPLVHVVTDRHRIDPVGSRGGRWSAAFERWLDDVLEAGPDVVQLRERDLEAGALERLARRVASQAAGTAVRVLVNDRADVAWAAGADGVHLRSDGPPASRIRAMGPPGWTVGRSVHSAGEAVAHRDCAYLIFGTVFPTSSKPADAPIAGLAGLVEAVQAVNTPVIAIGGMTVTRAMACARAGAAGVAAIGLFLPAGAGPSALGPARAVAALRAAMLE